MNFEFIKEAISSPWQIEPHTLNSMLPVFRSMLNGLQIEKSSEPEANIPYLISASELSAPMCNDQENESGNIESQEPSLKVIHVLPVRSVLTKHDQDCGPVGTRTLASRLLKADADLNVLGHILLIESGGGQSIAVPELTDAIQNCTKPIIAWIDGMAASAAYYIACYAREIIASRETDMIGCIGTMATYEGRKSKSAENSLGEVSVTIYADGSEQKNEEYEKAINEFDFKLIKEHILNPLNEKFKSDIQACRPSILPGQLLGRTYFASEVVGSLIDSVGSFESALNRILELSNYVNEIPMNQQSNNTQKVMKQFAHLNNVLQVDHLESSEDGSFLNEEQLQTIEDLLESNEQLFTERNSAIQELTTATKALAVAQTSLAAAYDLFNAIDPTIAASETAEAKASAIRTLLASQLSATPVQLLKEDEEQMAREVDWSLIDNLAYNKQFDLNT
jgi:protease IV